jgi:NADPH:quinone reductase-like Zn-dependent oxidoreductase
VLQIRTVPDPRPRDKEVCIRLVATAVTASDCIVRGLKLRGIRRLFMRAAFGFRAPRKGIIGMIAAGEIESVGREVTSFKPGDQVFGMNGFRAGTYAEKVCWPIGTSAVQLARHLGAEVTGVCSTANLELVRSLGAATVIDYTKDDFT